MGPPKEIDTRTLPVERGLVCQCGCTMAVAVCDCGTADEFRKETRTMMDQGQSNDAILASYVAKYGEKVLTAPTKRGFNLTAWIMPFLALALGAVLLMTLLRRWSRAYQASPAAAAAAEAPLTVEEEALYESTVAGLTGSGARFCHHCGAALPHPGQRFCHACGQAQQGVGS